MNSPRKNTTELNSGIPKYQEVPTVAGITITNQST
jgi:hypothetical protein